MFDTETTALLRTILDDVCRDLSPHATSIRARVASTLLKHAVAGVRSAEDLKEAGRRTVRESLREH
jgi:hypothetical protein